MTEFVITDPSGKEFVVNAPEGASQEQALEFAKSQFPSTSGGAAIGNPNVMDMGAKQLRPDFRSPLLGDLGDIVGSGAIGGGLGAFSSEILRGAGNLLGGFPYPATQRLGGFLKGAGETIRAGGRIAPSVAGAVSGVGSEIAGKSAEALGADPVTSEVARIAGGGASGETINAATTVLKKYALTPALGLISKFKHETAKVILEKLEGASVPLSQQEAKFVEDLISEIRNGQKTDKPLEYVGSIMGDQGKKLLGQSDQMMTNALMKAGGVGGPSGMPATTIPLSDIGEALRKTITSRNEAAITARTAQYKSNESLRDSIVSQREKAGNYVSDMPEYSALLDELKKNLVPGARSPSVQAGYQKMISELEIPGELQKSTIKGGISFQALDDVRRKLGDAYRGKPAEGYEAIGETAAKDLYERVSDLQKKFAGPAQTKLLEDYAAQTKGLEAFTSKTGKKATALDQYREEQYATDPSSIPSAFFKTRASIQALKELTGNQAQVNAAALAYVDHELAGKTSSEIRAWMGKNNEWLSETRPALSLVEKYASRVQDAEQAMTRAQDFAKQASKDANMLTRQSLPAQRAVDLIRSGDTELWSKVAPVIAKSPQAKTQMIGAVRQVIGDVATAESTSNLFARNIRPFLEQSNLASKAEMDFIAKKLSDIQTLNIPELEKLGIAKRLLFNSLGGWLSSASSRTGFQSKAWAVPQ